MEELEINSLIAEKICHNTRWRCQDEAVDYWWLSHDQEQCNPMVGAVVPCTNADQERLDLRLAYDGPDFCNDLNAIRMAVACLNETQWEAYSNELTAEWQRQEQRNLPQDRSPSQADALTCARCLLVAAKAKVRPGDE